MQSPIGSLELNGQPQDADADRQHSRRPTSLNWTLDGLLSIGTNFVPVTRVSASLSPENLSDIISHHEHKGLPLIVEGWHLKEGWDPELMSADWLAGKFEERQEFQTNCPVPHPNEPALAQNVWDVYAREDRPMTISQLLDAYRTSKEYAEEYEKERLYGKDIIFPQEWYGQINALPAECLPFRDGDTFACMNPEERPETIMCYLGIGDTYTAIHKDSSASTGYNLMVHTSSITDATPEQDENAEDVTASAFWFLTAAEDASTVSQFFLKKLGQALDFQAHYTTIPEFTEGDFKVYVCEQKLGDLVLVPRQSCHQVVNHGGISLKVAWSRMPLRSLEAALLEELPVYRRVGRPEIYRVKLLIEQTVKSYTSRIAQLTENEGHYFTRLLRLLTDIHVEEYHHEHKKHLAEDVGLRLTCDCCAADIYQAYFECAKCAHPSEPSSSYITCPTCYVEGRSCQCALMEPRISRPWDELLAIRNQAAIALGQPKLKLKDYESHGVPLRTNPIPIFRAGINLRRLLQKGVSLGDRVPKSCNGNKMRPTHTAALAALVPCRHCHRTTCFHHHLSAHTHAVEALLIYGEGGDDSAWHQWHTQARQRFKSAHQPGSEDMYHTLFRLIRAAQTYTACVPADKTRTKLGWYDQEYLDENTTESQSKGPVSPHTQPAKSQPTAQKRSSLLLDQPEATAKRSKKPRRTNPRTSLKASTSQLPDSDSKPPALPTKKTPKQSKSKNDITTDVQSPVQRMDGVETDDHSSSPKTNVPVFQSNGLLAPLPPLRGPQSPLKFAELDRRTDTDVEPEPLPSPPTPRSRPSQPSPTADVSPDHRMDIDMSPSLPPPTAAPNFEPPALDLSASTATSTDLAGVIEQMRKELAAERLLWRKDAGNMQAVYESRVHEIEEHHQQVLAERDSREKLLVSEVEEMKVRLARSDERLDTMVQTYMSIASTGTSPLSSPSRQPSFSSTSGGAAALKAQEQLSPAPKLPKSFGLSSFVPPPLFAAAPSAGAPKTPQKPSTSSQ